MSQPNNSLTSAALTLGVDVHDLMHILPALRLAKELRANGAAAMFRDTATPKVEDFQAQQGKAALVSFKVTADCYHIGDYP